MDAKSRSAGMTLLGLLVLVSVLAVLLMIVLSNERVPRPNRSLRAMTEIHTVELALTKIMIDAGVSDLREFFDDTAFASEIDRMGREQGLDAFAASVELYTYNFYVLMRRGREATGETNSYRSILRKDMVDQLGLSYYEELGNDPWGHLYQVFPGPWPADMGPVLFRQFIPMPPISTRTDQPRLADRLSLPPSEFINVGYGWPAPSNQTFYIWSFGENGISGQPRYDPSHAYEPPVIQHYAGDQEPEMMGGGDDINNWDREQTCMYWYN